MVVEGVCGEAGGVICAGGGGGVICGGGGGIAGKGGRGVVVVTPPRLQALTTTKLRTLGDATMGDEVRHGVFLPKRS